MLLLSSHGVPLRSYRVLGGDSLRCHGAVTVLSLRFHGDHSACAALSCAVKRGKEAVTSKNAVQSPCKCNGRPPCLHNHPKCARPRSSYCVVEDLTAQLWRPYGDPSALLGYRATEFVLSLLKVRAIAWRSMRSHRVYWRCHCVAVAMLEIVLCAPQRSAFF